MARQSASTLRTVRFYEEAGLIAPNARSEGGHRLFDQTQLTKLQLILDLKETGLSLNHIKSLFALKAGCPSAKEASAQLTGHLEAQIQCMQRKIALLRRLREELASCVSAIQECHTCTDQRFPHKCGGCEVMARPDLPRALRVFWGI
jgi:DNA-binding transcriptional MerR regulator